MKGMVMRRVLFFLIMIAQVYVVAKANDTTNILSLKERSEFIDKLLAERIDKVLPQLMIRSDIDMWLVISREYNEDPVIKTLLPANWMSARRRTILLMYLPAEEKGKQNPKVETLAVARYAVGEKFKSAWNKEQQPDQWARLVELITERKPNKIGVNFSRVYGLADGINATDLELLKESLPKDFHSKIVSAESLAIGWLETRSESELKIYPKIVGIAQSIIKEAFSNNVITPGQTTTEDVVWWMREKVAELKMDIWFHPTVSIQRKDSQEFDHISAFSKDKAETVIMPGDLLHTDFGITYLRLNTDTQQHAYVLDKCEKDAPEELKQALAEGNRLQDILMNNFVVGRTGNQLLKMSRKEALEEGLNPSIYSHPLGFHGHGAGPSIGMWDNQNGVTTGDYPLFDSTAYSIELNIEKPIERWGKSIRIMLEEDASFKAGKINFLHGRQKQFHLITSDSNCEP